VGHEFEMRRDMELDADAAHVWEAIATGPGLDSWFMGHNTVEPGEGGTVATAFGNYTPRSAVTAWEPRRRLAHHTGEAEDGRFLAYEFLIEGRDRSSTVLRVVTSGFLPGDDWEDEYEAMTMGSEMFLRTLAAYVAHFPGRAATPITAIGPSVDQWERAWAALRGELGLTRAAAEGDRVRFVPPGGPPVDGVVYFTNAHTLGVRTDDALYRFFRGLQGVMVAMHHLFTDGVDEQATERAWQAWLHRLPV
jgi:uncharacterized protein YndB with AHSA1/START domain